MLIVKSHKSKTKSLNFIKTLNSTPILNSNFLICTKYKRQYNSERTAHSTNPNPLTNRQGSIHGSLKLANFLFPELLYPSPPCTSAGALFYVRRWVSPQSFYSSLPTLQVPWQLPVYGHLWYYVSCHQERPKSSVDGIHAAALVPTPLFLNWPTVHLHIDG